MSVIRHVIASSRRINLVAAGDDEERFYATKDGKVAAKERYSLEFAGLIVDVTCSPTGIALTLSEEGSASAYGIRTARIIARRNNAQGSAARLILIIARASEIKVRACN